jgi:hypothetical protein
MTREAAAWMDRLSAPHHRGQARLKRGLRLSFLRYPSHSLDAATRSPSRVEEGLEVAMELRVCWCRQCTS